MTAFVGSRPPCPVHPHGYHDKPRVNATGSRRVLRHHSLVGLPARCPTLEEELLEADREIDMQDELAVMQRTAAPVHGVLVALAVGAVLVCVTALDTPWLVALLGAVVVFGLERIGSAVQRERMSRIVDWRRRVGR